MSKRLGFAVALALLGACSNDSGGRFFIVQNQVPAMGCVSNTTRTLYLGEGMLDLSLVGNSPFAYVLAPLLQNDFPAIGMAGAPEPNRLFVRAFRVRIEPGAGAPPRVTDLFARLDSSEQTHALLEFQNPWAATIEPGGGILAAFVDVVPGELARQIQATGALAGTPEIPLTLRVRAVGKGQEGDVESEEFVYPIRVCDGCLGNNIGACPKAPVNLGHACNPAQDFTVDCCQAGAELVCPSIRP